MHAESLILPIVIALAGLTALAATASADPPDFAKPVCAEPAATGLKVVNDRWPDASCPRQFALDAIRLENARTDPEKAIAIWLWVRRFTMYTNGQPPTERVASGRGYVSDPSKILNVWGAHWCDGLSRCMELSWRHLGLKAQKFYKSGHTLCDAAWVDADGVERYHVFDVSEGWFAWTRDGSRLASADEIARDWSLVHRPAVGPLLRHESSASIWGWVHATHLPYEPTHKVELQMRPGERFVRYWGNVGKPFQDNVGRKGDNVPEEHGPHPVDYGNGVWTLSAQIDAALGRRQCVSPARNIATTGPEVGGVWFGIGGQDDPGGAVYRFVTPYVISSLLARYEFDSGPGGTRIDFELSTDNGKTWRTFEDPAPTASSPDDVEAAGSVELAPVTKEGKEVSAFGRYDVLVRVRLRDGFLRKLTFETTVQQNFYSLPQLLPGDNRITVHGKLAKGQAVRVSYLWDDPAGKERRNVVIAEELPYAYTIRAAGSKWGDVVCKSLNMEVVPADGKGSRTEVKEADSPLEAIQPLADLLVSLGKNRDKPVAQVPTLRPLDEYLAVLKDPAAKKKDLHDALAAVRVIGDGRAYDAVRAVALSSVDLPKFQALQTMYWLDRKRAIPQFLAILRHKDPDIQYKQDEKDVRVRNGHYAAVVAQAALFLADERVGEAVPDLLKTLAMSDKDGMWDEPKRAIIRSLGALGDRQAVPVLLKFVDVSNPDDGQVAAEALGRLGDPQAAPAIRAAAARSDYTPMKRDCLLALGLLKDREAISLLRASLSHKDEDVRGSAAEAIGRIGDGASLDALRAQLAVEPVEWVRAAIRQAIDRLAKP